MMDYWKGEHFQGTLILAESWYGEEVDLSTYISQWSKFELNDYLFTRIFNSCSGLKRGESTLKEREAFWDSIAFENVINWSIGSRMDRPNSQIYKKALSTLDARIRKIDPKRIWALGSEQFGYSSGIINSLRIQCVSISHPCSYGVKNTDLEASWQKLF